MEGIKMPKSLKFDTGVNEYEVNGSATIRFNPTDADFIERFQKAVEELDARQGEMQAEVDGAGEDPAKMYGLLASRDADMRTAIDGLFGQGTADAVFPSINCYALADGLPVWMNFMFAIAEEITDGIEAEHGKADPRVKALGKKYDGMLAKYRKARR